MMGIPSDPDDGAAATPGANPKPSHCQLLHVIHVAKGKDTGTYSVIVQDERDGWLVKVYDPDGRLVESEESQFV